MEINERRKPSQFKSKEHIKWSSHENNANHLDTNRREDRRGTAFISQFTNLIDRWLCRRDLGFCTWFSRRLCERRSARFSRWLCGRRSARCFGRKRRGDRSTSTNTARIICHKTVITKQVSKVFAAGIIVVALKIDKKKKLSIP